MRIDQVHIMPKETTPSVAEQADERYCLGCNKLGHLTTECHSTHGLNTPADRELFRLTCADHASQAASHSSPEPVAWQERQQTREGWTSWYNTTSEAAGNKAFGKKLGGIEYEWRPLFVAPPAPFGAESKACASAETVAREDFDKMSGDLTRAKNLLVRLWNKHPDARAQIEASTGSWFAWGQDRESAPLAPSAWLKCEGCGKDMRGHDRMGHCLPAGGSNWSGWACQYPGKLPRLYGAREIAEVNLDEENGDRLLFVKEVPHD